MVKPTASTIRWLAVISGINFAAVSAAAQTLITFDDISGQAFLSAFAPDRYMSQGVLFTQANGAAPRVWFCGCPSVQTDPNGGAWTSPNAMAGDGAGASLRARFVVPGSLTPTTVSAVSVYILSGPGSDSVQTGLSLIAFDAQGIELVRSQVPPGVQFSRLTVEHSGIASVLLEASSLLEVFDNFQWSCDPVRITGDPAPEAACASADATFSVAAMGAGPFTYQWQWQPAGPGSAWAALENGINLNSQGTPAFDVSGVTDAAATVRSISGASGPVGDFRCIVTNGCGSVTSNPASLTICVADFNCDGFLDFFDYDAFVECYEVEVCGDGSADFNADGFIDFFDYDDFVGTFEAGC